MKAHNSIDDMFQQHFAETNIQMHNQEALWQRIAARKNDKRRGFIWFSLLGILLVGIVGFTVINLSNTNNQIAVIDPEIISNNYSTPPNSSILTPINTDKENKKKSIIKVNPEINSKSIKTSTPDPIINPTVSSSSISTTASESITEQSNSPNNSIITDADPTTNSIIKKKIEKESVLSPSGIHPLEIKSFHFKVSDKPHSIESDKPKVSQSDSWSKCEVKTPGHFFVDAYGQGGVPMDDIGFSQTGADQTAFKDLWDQRFDPKASWHGGIQIGYEFKNGLRASVGAEYQELVTQYGDNQRITEIIRVWDPQAYFTEDVNGDRVWVGDTVTAINIYDRKFVKKNKHTLIHVPIQLSYDIYKKPSFHIALDVAAALNISKSYEGQFIRGDQTLIAIDSNNEDNYLSNDIGVSIAAGLHFGYYKNDHLEFYLSPRFRYNPNSYLLNTETLKITRNIVGLRGGIRYHF